jgi:hypothetical protein
MSVQSLKAVLKGRFDPLFRPGGKWSRRRLGAAAAAALVLLAGIGLGSYFLAGSSGHASARMVQVPPGQRHHPNPHQRHQRHHRSRRHRRARVVAVRRPRPVCPLTGMPPPHGRIPQRVVLGVKVGNNPSARPQSGLEFADVVFDTLAEGGITRYIAVYQCNEAPSVGPIRSVRWDDWHILEQFHRAALAFVGGIMPDQNAVASYKWICNLNDFVRPELYHQDPYRIRPDATYSSTALMWSACRPAAPPPTLFRFSPRIQPGSTAVSSAEIVYSPYEADIVWQWSAQKHAFLHAYRENGVIVPDYSAGRIRLRAHNVLIMVVSLQYGAFAESPGSTGDVESITIGHGPAFLLRDGRLIRGTWVRRHWAYMAHFLGPDGHNFWFEPGDTWVEIVPRGDPITFSYPPRPHARAPARPRRHRTKVSP